MDHPIFAFGLPHGAEWLYILIGIIVLFGADRIPKLARGLGKSLGEFKKAKEDFEKEIHNASVEVEAPKKVEGQNQIGGNLPTTLKVNSEPTPSDELTKKS